MSIGGNFWKDSWTGTRGNSTFTPIKSIHNKYKPGSSGVGASSISIRRAKNRSATVVGEKTSNQFRVFNTLGLYNKNAKNITVINTLTTQNPSLTIQTPNVPIQTPNVPIQTPIVDPITNGTFSFNYTLPSPSTTVATVKNNLPFIWLTGTFELVGEPNIDINLTSSVVTVTLNTKLFTNSPNLNTTGFDFGLTFKNVISFYGSRNVNIIQILNIPLSKSRSQFSLLTNLSIVQGQNPIILPNTSLSSCFNRCTNFNSDISSWNTSNVNNMNSMFQNAIIFDKPIGNWDTHNVTKMINMFYNAQKFDQPIGTWNISNVTECYSMFQNAYLFNQPIGTWNTSNVTNCGSMFQNAYLFNQPIGTWNTSNVTDCGSMFQNAYLFNQTIGDWNTLNFTNINSIFNGATNFNNGDLPGGTSKKMKWTFNTAPTSFDWQRDSALTQANAPDSLPF